MEVAVSWSTASIREHRLPARRGGAQARTPYHSSILFSGVVNDGACLRHGDVVDGDSGSVATVPVPQTVMLVCGRQ